MTLNYAFHTAYTLCDSLHGSFCKGVLTWAASSSGHQYSLLKSRSGYMRNLINHAHVNKSVVFIGQVVGIKWAKLGQIWACLQSLSLVSLMYYIHNRTLISCYALQAINPPLHGTLQFPLQFRRSGSLRQVYCHTCRCLSSGQGIQQRSLDRLRNSRAMEKMHAIIPPMFLSISHFSIAVEYLV